MSDAFVEQDTILYRNLVTFVTGFGVIADQPFNIGSSASTNSYLNAYNQIRPYGGISGHNFTGSIITGGNFLLTDGKSFYPSSAISFDGTFLNLSIGHPSGNGTNFIGPLLTNNLTGLLLQGIINLGDPQQNNNGFTCRVDGVNDKFYVGYGFSGSPIIYTNGINTNAYGVKVGIGTQSPAYNLDIVGNCNATQGLYVSGIPVVLSSQTGGFGGNSVSAWSNLIWNTGTLWQTLTNGMEDRKILTLTGNTTLNISGLYNGWNGVLQVIQSGASTSGYSLILPIGTRVMSSGNGLANLTMQSGSIDCLGFVYDGTKLLMNIGNQFN